MTDSFVITHEISYNYDGDPCLSPIMGRNYSYMEKHVKSFRLLDDDDIVYYKGFYFGDGDGFEPLLWSAYRAGCTKIQYYQKQSDGLWGWYTL